MAAASVVTNSGLAITTGRLIGGASPAQAEPKYVQWGTNNTATAAKGDTVLATPAAEARVAGTATQATTTVTNDTVQCVATITSASAQSIWEVGRFDAAGTGSPATGGAIYDHHTFAAATGLNTGDSIQFTLKAQYQ